MVEGLGYFGGGRNKKKALIYKNQKIGSQSTAGKVLLCIVQPE